MRTNQPLKQIIGTIFFIVPKNSTESPSLLQIMIQPWPSFLSALGLRFLQTATESCLFSSTILKAKCGTDTHTHTVHTKCFFFFFSPQPQCNLSCGFLSRSTQTHLQMETPRILGVQKYYRKLPICRDVVLAIWVFWKLLLHCKAG